VEHRIVQPELIKYYPPDPVSIIFWLKNRKPEQWRDKQEAEHKGNVIVELVTFAGNNSPKSN